MHLTDLEQGLEQRYARVKITTQPYHGGGALPFHVQTYGHHDVDRKVRTDIEDAHLRAEFLIVRANVRGESIHFGKSRPPALGACSSS